MSSPELLSLSEYRRRFPVGVELSQDGKAHFRVWAPGHRRVDVVFEDSPEDCEVVSLKRESRNGPGYFSGSVSNVSPGTTYRYRVDGSERLFPDPASRFQPDGPHGASQVID